MQVACYVPLIDVRRRSPAASGVFLLSADRRRCIGTLAAMRVVSIRTRTVAALALLGLLVLLAALTHGSPATPDRARFRIVRRHG